MHKFINKNRWAVLIVGIVLVVIGESQVSGQAANGTGKQMFFDTVALVGLILTLSGIALLFKKRRPEE